MVFKIDPLKDSRWTEFVGRQPDASIFHTPEWLEALRRTYGYASVVYTTAPPDDPLANGVVLCDVRSWLTGRRLVSVPFADHCQPLFDTASNRDDIMAELRGAVLAGWRYVELRPVTADLVDECRMGTGESFCFHRMDLRAPVEQLFQGLHKDSIQRKVRRAERESLDYESGNSESLIRTFYRLHLMTRRRHRLPPQPIAWFTNLAACLGDRLSVGIARKDGRPVAGMVLLRSGATLVYKYGASDERFHQLGSMPFLFWSAIRQGKESGVRELDLGRTDADNPGLITFKDRLGAARTTMTYARYPAPVASSGALRRLAPGIRRVFASLPDPFLTTTGRLLYRHMG